MSRTIPAGLLTALQGDTISPYYAVEFLFDSGDIRLWTGNRDTTINGDTYLAAGSLLGLQGLSEVSDLSAQGVTISLSGIPASIVSLALSESYQRRICNVYFGVLEDTNVINVFSGYMNTMSIEDSGEASTISLLVDSKLVGLERTKEQRYNDQQQRAKYPNDTFFSYVTRIQDKDILWGRTK